MAETGAIRVAIVGPTGYTGLHLIEWLARHPHAEVVYLASHREALPDIRAEFPQLTGRIDPQAAQCRPIDAEQIARAADVAFLGLPHKAAMAYVPALLDAGVRVIDLSADYRLTSPDLYERVYATPHHDPANLAEAVYGLPELFRDKLPGAMLVANPGCYPTAAAIAVAPLISHSLVHTQKLIINAASGVTGAGRKVNAALQFAAVNESYRAYGEIGNHRHQPEIAQTLSTVAGKDVRPLFVPHLLPIDRGILQTIYLQPVDADVTEEDLWEAYADAYADEPFIRLGEGLPDVKHVAGSNFCDLTFRVVGPPDDPTIVVFAALDNMIKGASGQAIQNMNIVYEMDETAGLL